MLKTLCIDNTCFLQNNCITLWYTTCYIDLCYYVTQCKFRLCNTRALCVVCSIKGRQDEFWQTYMSSLSWVTKMTEIRQYTVPKLLGWNRKNSILPNRDGIVCLVLCLFTGIYVIKTKSKIMKYRFILLIFDIRSGFYLNYTNAFYTVIPCLLARNYGRITCKIIMLMTIVQR